MSYQPKVYFDNGGDRQVVASGGSISVESGGAINTAGQVADITYAAASAAANVCEVTITAVDSDGTAVAAPVLLDVWLSDAATGVGLTGTTASGTVTAKAASGAVFSTYTAKKDLRVQTLATGVFVLEITDTAKTGFYVAATHPVTGAAVVSDQLVTADYG